MAKQAGPVDIRFPTGGVVRRYGYQFQPPYTAPDALNVRPYDTVGGRERGGSRPRLTKAIATQLGKGNPVQLLSSMDTIDSLGVLQHTLVAVADGVVYRSTSTGEILGTGGYALLETEGSVTITTEDAGFDIAVRVSTLNEDLTVIQGTQRGQKFYLADYEVSVVSAGDGAIANNNELTSGGVADWAALDCDTYSYVVSIAPRGASTTETGTFKITSLVAAVPGPTKCVLDATLTNGDVTYRLFRGPKEFDPVSGNLTSMAVPKTLGNLPDGCPLICTYRDRLVLAGPSHLWYMSRQGDPNDFEYLNDPGDPGRAIAGQNSDAGEVGEPITALIPHTDDYLIFGCENSVWILRGDPGYGGQLDSLSREIGIVSANAWCKMPDSSILFLSRDGVYQIPAGAQSYPVSISRETLPRELVDIDARNFAVSLRYDSRYRGVHIYVTPVAGTQATHWWLDWTTKSFWPVQIPAGHQPFCMHAYASDVSDQRHVFLGGFDGYVRRFSDTAVDDDGTAFTSWVIYGPLPLGSPGMDGMITELEADLAEGSENVSVAVYSGNTPEAACTATTSEYATTWSGGNNFRCHPRVRGIAAAIKLTGTGAWGIEGLTLLGRPGGRSR